jgi:hypothetical protein
VYNLPAEISNIFPPSNWAHMKANRGEYYTIKVFLTCKRLHDPNLKKHANANQCVTQQSYGNPASLTFS